MRSGRLGLAFKKNYIELSIYLDNAFIELTKSSKPANKSEIIKQD